MKIDSKYVVELHLTLFVYMILFGGIGYLISGMSYNPYLLVLIPLIFSVFFILIEMVLNYKILKQKLRGGE